MLDISSAGYVIGAITVGITFLSSLVRHLVLDKVKMREQKEKIKYHQEQMKIAQKNKDMKGMQKHQESMMEVMSEQMKHNFKPMLYTLIPFWIVFGWMNMHYMAIGTLHNVTVLDPMPHGAQVISISAYPNVTYAVNNGGIVWQLGNLTYPWDWERFGWYGDGHVNVSIKFKEAPSQSGSYLYADYTAFFLNGTSADYHAMKGDEPAGAFYMVKSKPSVEGNVMSYALDYENRNSYYVVNIFGVGLGWLRWYLLCSIVSSMIFNKIFGNT